MKKPLLLLTVAAILSSSVYAASAFTDAKDAVKYRQSGFQLIRHNMADIGDMLKGDVSYDAERVKKRATALATLSTLPWEAFTVPGAEKGGGDAKDAIWKNLSDFTDRGTKLAADAAALQTAADSGDQAEIRKAFGTFSRNCKACHDKYKN
ncbi:cytochrome c [Chromatiaceae bacterium AAb-1]|nr:cytochrome c [Chromatiaceae bacterium AAb-1]